MAAHCTLGWSKARILTDPGWVKSVRETRGLPLLAQEALTGNESTFTLAEYNLFDYMSSWIDPLVGTTEQRAAKLSDPVRRAAMAKDVETNIAPERTDWNRMRIVEVACERNYQYRRTYDCQGGADDGQRAARCLYRPGAR